MRNIAYLITAGVLFGAAWGMARIFSFPLHESCAYWALAGVAYEWAHSGLKASRPSKAIVFWHDKKKGRP